MLKELTLSAITNARERLGERVVTTPSLQWQGAELSKYLGSDTAVFVKLELFQRTGTFKARGGNKIVEDILLLKFHSGFMPFLAVFATTTKIRHHIDATKI